MCVNVPRTFTCLPVLFRLFPFELLSVGGGGCSFTPMLVNSDGWDGDHSSPGGGCDACVVVVDCESAFTYIMCILRLLNV